MNNHSRNLTLAMTSLFISSSAIACPNGYYSDDLGFCWPTDKTVINDTMNNLDPRAQAGRMLALSKALASGNYDDIKKSLGNVMLNSPGCIACSSLATTVLPKLSKEQINGIVGEGFLTFVATGNPVLVVIDTAKNVINEKPITPPARNPFDQVPPVSVQRFSGKADCIVRKKNTPDVMAAWINAPQLAGVDGTIHTFPVIQLNKNDIIQLTSPLCPQYNTDTQTSLSNVIISYQYSTTLPGDSAKIKFIFSGNEIIPAAIPAPGQTGAPK